MDELNLFAKQFMSERTCTMEKHLQAFFSSSHCHVYYLNTVTCITSNGYFCSSMECSEPELLSWPQWKRITANWYLFVKGPPVITERGSKIVREIEKHKKRCWTVVKKIIQNVGQKIPENTYIATLLSKLKIIYFKNNSLSNNGQTAFAAKSTLIYSLG